MFYGGNRNLRKFLNENQIPKNIKKEDVFMSNIMNYYRRKLLKEVREELFEEEPPNPKERFNQYKETKEELISDDEDEEIIDNRNKIFKDNEYNKFSQQYSRKSKFLTLVEQEPNESDLSKYLKKSTNDKNTSSEKETFNEGNISKMNGSSYPTLPGIATSVWNYGSKVVGFGYNYLSYLLKPSQTTKIVPEEFEGNNYSECLINK